MGVKQLSVQKFEEELERKGIVLDIDYNENEDIVIAWEDEEKYVEIIANPDGNVAINLYERAGDVEPIERLYEQVKNEKELANLVDKLMV